jgi:hypothetical protein
MEYITQVKSLTGDAFLTLPLLLMGFIFFFGLLTSNTGLLWLFLGQLLLVPALGFLSNEPLQFTKDDKLFDFLKLFKFLISAGSTLGLQGSMVFSNSDYSWIPWLIWIFSFTGFLFKKENNEKQTQPACSMIPDDSSTYTTPSSWMTHIAFLFGFLFNNALSIYNEPTPEVVNAPDDDTRAKREASVAKNVENRKWFSALILAMITIFFFILLIFRYRKTPCEGSFTSSILPLTYIMTTGASWFHFIWKSCGVRPVDVLGIVQGMVSPDMLNTPIVCVGS